MAISVAPLIAISLDAASVNAVIMQLEIEHETAKGEAKAKEVIKEYDSGESLFSPAGGETLIKVRLVALNNGKHPQAFYPAIPTPPPNA